MQRFALRDEVTEAELLPRRIERLLQNRHAMCVGELCLRLGLQEGLLRAQLERMTARGEVERLRPVGCERDEYDFFRLARAKASQAVRPWVSGNRSFVRLAESMACVAD
jgi:hypothetical protein